MKITTDIKLQFGDSEQYSVCHHTVHRECSGVYSLSDMRLILADMEALQAALDAGTLRAELATNPNDVADADWRSARLGG